MDEAHRDFAGKRALVTGAGQGIGREIALALSRAGAQVFALSRSAGNLQTLKEQDETITTIQADISEWEPVQKAVKSCLPIDLLVNNAGIGFLEDLVDVTPEVFDKTFAINVRGTIAVSQVVARDLLERKAAGAIVNISSQASQRALPHHTVYCASKAALDSLTRSMALELGPHKIRTNAVNPTVVLTELGRRVWGPEEMAAPMRARIPLAKFAQMDDVVQPVLFLLGDGAQMINGATLPIDGGFWTA